MADFDIIEYGYNIADETINFGTRSLADGDNLYEASTLATLKCSLSNEGKSCPHLNAVVKNGFIHFNVDGSMKIFKDKACSSVVFNACFDAVVDTFCLSSDGSYLFICLRNGMVHLVHCNNDYEFITSTSLTEDKNKSNISGKFYVDSFVDDNSFFIVTRTGQIFRISIQNEIEIEVKCIHHFNFKTEIVSFQYPFMLVSGTKLAILNFKNDTIIFDANKNLKKVVSVDNMFLGLDFEGNLFGICAVTLVIFPLYNSTLYKDFLICGSNNQRQIIAVTEDESQNFFIQLISYPEFSKIFSLKISTEVHLITPECINDEILYISKISHDNSVNELRFHIVYETEPEQRLLRLLRKHKYEEAEKFAIFFHLDLAIINKARAQAIIDKSVCESDDINVLINLLNMIDDDEFKLQCCLDVESFCSKFDDVRRILNYGCSLTPKKQNKLIVEELQKSITRLMFRFDTFTALNWETDYMMRSWLQFSGSDLIEELTAFLRNHHIEEAKIVYSRLDELTEEHVADVLCVLNNMSFSVYQPFLPIFIPVTLSILPSTLPLFVKWTYSKVLHLEKRSKLDFPNNAIKFTENILGLMKVGDATDISFQRQCMLHRDNLGELSLLLSALKSLKTLKYDFRITIPLSDYLSGPVDVIRNLLNVQLCPEDFDVLLKDFLFKFMLENHLDPNEIFFNEINDLMKYEEEYWINIVTSILNCISSVTIKLEAVKKILDYATVPWRNSIRQIANDSLKYFHPLVSEIRELIENEPIQVVLRKHKYKIKEKRISDDVNILKFVVGRIIYCNEETMVEDVYQLCKTPAERHVCNMLLIEHFIRSRCFERAMNLLDNNTPEEIKNCAQELAYSIQIVVNDETRLPAEIRSNYYHVAGAIFRRLDDKSDEFERSCNEETMNLIRNVYNLHENFQIKTTSDSLRPLSNKYKVVDDILEDVCREFETGKRTVEETFSICHKIAASLSLDYDDIYVKLCEKTGDYNLIFKIARRIYDQESSSKNLCLMAILLIKYIGIYKIQLSDDSFLESEGLILSDTNCIVDNDDFCHGLQLAEKIVARAVFKAQLEDLSACVEVVNWVNTSFCLTRNQNNELKKILFGDIYGSTSILPGFLTFSFIRNAYNMCSNFIGTSSDPKDTYLTRFKCDTLTEDQLFAEIKQLPIMVENLCKEGQHFMSFKVVSQLQNSLMHIPNIDTNILIFLNDVLKKQCLPKLLPSILSNSVIDSDLLYNLLLSCNCNDGVQFIMNSLRLYKRHPRKFQCIAQTGLRFWEYQNLSCGKSEIMKSLIALKWWKKFEKKQFDYDSFFKVQSDERFELLINSDCLDTKLVEEYSVDYNVCLKLSYKYFLKRTFLNWKPDYEIKSKTSNGRYLVMKNNEDALLEKCQEIIKLIDKHEVLTIIIDVWSCVNRYYYEVFITMFNIIAEIDPKQDNNMKLSMLFFLRDYQRVSKPSEAETESWYTTFPESRSLDTLSEFRLPFSPCLFTRQIWSIIRPEINLKTYKLWFNAIEIVAPYLNKNDICTYVVHDVVASGLLSKDVSEKWVLYPKHEDLFSEIDECILHISDLERTTSVVYHLLTHTPNGADQVNAATLCYKYAVQYKNLNEGKSDVEKAFIKVEKKYFNSCVMHILHMHQLAETKYVNLVAQPNDLIFALYLDERILKKSESIDLYCPDINETTEAIASLFGLDINKIRHTLLENWLLECPSTSFDFDSSIIYTQNSSCESDNLIRAAYICCTGNIQFWRTYLLKIGLNSEPEVQKSVGYKAKALKVFAMISDVETITNLIELSYDEFMNFIDKLTLVYNLEYLGIDLDVEALDRYSKKELLNRLAQRAGNLLTIKTMASICMTYKIYNLKYWEFIINTSIKFSMFVELKSYVNFLKKVEYRYKKFYINAWQKLIENSFTSINNIQENQIHQVLVDNFLTIQCCPVVYCLNFDSVFRKCMNTGKIEFAAVLLQYVDGERRDKFVKEIRNSNKDFGTSLSNLAQNGLWGIPHVRAILVEVND